MALGAFVWPWVKPVSLGVQDCSFAHGCLRSEAADMLICRPACVGSAKETFRLIVLVCFFFFFHFYSPEMLDLSSTCQLN